MDTSSLQWNGMHIVFVYFLPPEGRVSYGVGQLRAAPEAKERETQRARNGWLRWNASLQGCR